VLHTVIYCAHFPFGHLSRFTISSVKYALKYANCWNLAPFQIDFRNEMECLSHKDDHFAQMDEK